MNAIRASFGLADGSCPAHRRPRSAARKRLETFGRFFRSERRRGERTPDALLVSHTRGYERRTSDVPLLASPTMVRAGAGA